MPSPVLTEPAVLHQDEHLLVVDKPAGLLSVPGKGDAGLHNLMALLQAQFEGALLVHRLDMATSGLMVFARNKAAQQRLGLAFEQRRVSKTYTALVWGRPLATRGEVDMPLAADWPNRPRQMVNPVDGRAAITHWQVLAPLAGDAQSASSQTSLLLSPITGRSHQLRVHMQWLGHPIVGDALYGQAGDTAPRLMLHATTLSLDHPATGLPCHFECPPPF
jgi:tRNA pseudouridine32 synthase / 23S rRNA pseudouridine746 synthase